MPHGQEDQMLREKMLAYINRWNGRVEEHRMVGDRQVTELMAHMNRIERFYFLNGDGSLWQPQNPDGSFPYLPGYDGPISSE